MKTKKLGIYIHIPFCIKKCRYCDFLSFATGISQRISQTSDAGVGTGVNNYIKSLTDRIIACKNNYTDYIVDTIFIGGGTPSILPPRHISSIMEAIFSSFDVAADREVTIECNPGTVDKDKLSTYRKCGINRLSFGLQSAVDSELKEIGRIHTFSDFRMSYCAAREAGFDNINIDIMSALPNQTLSSYIYTVDSVLSLNPEHISSYSLIIEEGTPMYGIDPSLLPDEDTDRQMYHETKVRLAKHGYNRYEISNYARKGRECAHNIGYWTRKDYLGIGLGASSLINNVRFRETDNLDNFCHENFFIKKGEYCDIEVLSEKEQMEEFMFLGLRLTAGINTDDFEKNFHVSYDSVYGDITAMLISKGLIIRSGKNIRLTDFGIDVSNFVLAEFLL